MPGADDYHPQQRLYRETLELHPQYVPGERRRLRTISAVTPVDDRTSDVRFMVYIGRTPGRDDERRKRRPVSSVRRVIRQFTQDVHIWQHQRYSDPPALANAEMQGFTAIRKWATKFYPDGLGGSAAELRSKSATATTEKGRTE